LFFHERVKKGGLVHTKNMESQRLPAQPQFTGAYLRYISAFLCYTRYTVSDLNVPFLLYIRSAQPVAGEQHLARDTVVLLPTETSGLRKFLLNPSLSWPRWKAEAIFKTYELFTRVLVSP
jgi:hypothetical protein